MQPRCGRDAAEVRPSSNGSHHHLFLYAQAHNGCVMSNDLYRDHVAAVAKRGGDERGIKAWLKAHCISYTFCGAR